MALHGQRGSFTPLVGAVTLVLAAVALGGITVGRLTAVKRDSQRAADGAALAATQLIRDRGMPLDATIRAAAEDVGRGNSNLPVTFAWSVTEDADSVDIEVTAQIQVAGPTLVMGGGTRLVTSRAKASVTQTRFDEADRRLPKLVLVLDYSGSMGAPFVGGGQKLAVLEDSVSALLARGLMVDYGGVLYSSNVFKTVGVGPSAPGQIQAAMDTYGAGGATNTGAAINAARNILTPLENTGYYVLVVSDGAPCCGGGAVSATRAAATNAWNNDVTMFTLEIRDSPPNPTLAALMTDIAGTPSSRGNSDYHFVAESAADLVDKFEDIIANIVCTVGPLDPVPGDPASLKVYLASGGAERAVVPVPPGEALSDYRGEERYVYDGADQKVRLTETACNAVIDDGDEIVVRFDRPFLTE